VFGRRIIKLCFSNNIFCNFSNFLSICYSTLDFRVSTFPGCRHVEQEEWTEWTQLKTLSGDESMTLEAIVSTSISPSPLMADHLDLYRSHITAHTLTNVLIEIPPSFRQPTSFKLFDNFPISDIWENCLVVKVEMPKTLNKSRHSRSQVLRNLVPDLSYSEYLSVICHQRRLVLDPSRSYWSANIKPIPFGFLNESA
jgi:hypothetical protein